MLCGGDALDLGGQKQRALLALLLLDANRVVPGDRLIDALWEQEPPETARKALQVYVSQLRKLVGRERLETHAPGYLLRVDPAELDLTRFSRLHEEGSLEEALSLWRGPPLGDLAEERFAQPEIARLEELRVVCLEERIERDLARGRHAELVGEVEALVRQHPMRERLRGQLMLALYRSGRQAEALEAYREARRGLVEELGIEPGRPLRDLHQAILEQASRLDLPERAEEAARSAFVGRGSELAELVGGLDDALAGHGRLFLLAGEPGIGKSRLAEELMAEARARGARVLVGRCWEAGGAPAYWPWVQSFRAFVRDSGAAALRAQVGAGAADLAQIVPELREAFPELPEPASLESEGARFRLFDATAELLAGASGRQPIVILLDDLHAADAPSLLLLRFLARELASTRVFILAAYRDVDPVPGGPLTEMLADVTREPATRRLVLTGLSKGDVARYIELTAPGIASRELVTALHDETAGNPLFFGEILRLLSVEGVPSDPTAEVRLTIPQSVHDVIARRLTHLSGECNRVLLLASVIGREFALDALARLAGISAEELLDVLDEAMGARVVSDVPGAHNRLRFAHVLIRDTLYDGLTTARRVRLHRLVVEMLEARYGEEPGPHLAELAHHSIAATDFDKGAEYAQRAGDRALSMLAFEESARLYEAALDALAVADPEDEKGRCELLVALGDADARAGDTPEATSAFLAAADIARRLGLKREMARAAVGYGGRMDWSRAGDDDRRVPLLEQALELLGDEDPELRVRLLGRLAGALRDEHSLERRDALSREAVQLARDAGSAAALTSALSGRAAAICSPDTVAERLELGSELREVAEGAGDRERVVAAHMHRVIALLQLGELRAVEAEVEAARRVADELRQPAQLWEVGGLEALMALAAGRLDEAERLVPEVFALGRRAHPDGAIPVYRVQRWALGDLRGTLEEVLSDVRDLVVQYPARPVFRCLLANLHASLGRPEARQELEKMVRDGCSALPFDQEWLFGVSLLAETAHLLGDLDSAAVLYELLMPWATSNVADPGEGFRGAAARDLGLLATAMERWEEAEHHFEAAVAMNAGMGARPWLARAREDFGRMLLARDQPGDRSRGLEMLGAALSAYRELGMHGYTRRAEAMVGLGSP